MVQAPIALFVYSRPWHTQQTVEALLRNRLAAESDLIIFADAAKTPEKEGVVEEVRSYISKIKGFKSIRIVERQTNFGLAKSIISGVTEVCREFGRVIVLEDDLVVSPYFLDYMNDGLNLYAEGERVASIHGYIYPVKRQLQETFFIRGADCWGWATWQRAWQHFSPDGEWLLSELERRSMTYEFDFNGAYPYTQMLRDQIAGKNDSWAIRWYASAFLQNMLTLYPSKALVRNIGFDGSGTHCGMSSTMNTEPNASVVEVLAQSVVENSHAKMEIANYLRSPNTPQVPARKSFWKRVYSLSRKVFSA